MADSGYNWGAWAFMDYSSGTDVDDIDVNDEATLTTDAVDLDGKAACEISVEWIEGNDGACDGDVYVYLLRDIDGTNYQTIDDNPQCIGVVDATQNTTRYIGCNVYPSEVGKFKVLVDNDSGQDGDLSLRIRTATIPAAS